jgi:hypothetical protein
VKIEKKLRSLGARLEALRDEIAIADEQLVHFEEVAERAQTDMLVQEDLMSRREYEQAQADLDRHKRHRDSLLAEVSLLRKEQDQLLDELSRG